MIISASRIATASGSSAVGAHVFRGPKNVSITVVRGSRPELDDMVRDARNHGAKYAIRHFKISPEQATTREEALAVAAALGLEFGFDPGRSVLVEHEKRRQGGAGFDRHWHLMVPEVDPVRGRVLDAHWMRARQEKVSRIAEIELGHDQVRGKWNRAVEAALRAEGRDGLADRVHPLTIGNRPAEAFSAIRHQVAERRGLSMPEMKAAVAAAWERSDNGPAFRAALAEQGLTARPGDKKGIWLVEATGADGEPVLVGSLARLTRAKAEEIGARMAEAVLAGAPAEPDVAAPATEAAQPSPEPSAVEVAPPVMEASAPSPDLPGYVPAPPVEALQPAPAGRHAPRPAGGRGASYGGGGGNGSDPFAGIAPLDTSKPGDWLRFLNETAMAQGRKLKAEAVAEAARTTTNGGSHAVPKPDHDQPSLADAIADAIQLAHTFRAERAASAAGATPDEPRMDPGGLARDRRPNGPGPGLPPSGDGPPGAVADRVRGVPGGVDLGSAPPAPGPAPADGGRGEDRDPRIGGGNVAGRGEGHESRDGGRPEGHLHGVGRAALDAGRDRAEAGRVEIALARHGDALARIRRKFSDLRDPAAAAVGQRASEQASPNAQIAASRARVTAVLSTSPFPDPADRSRPRLQDAARDRVTSAKDISEARMAASAARAKELRQRVGIVSKMLAAVGFATPAMQAARDADRIAEEARRAAHAVRLDYREDLAQAERLGTAQAIQREEQQQGWERHPDVADARREARGNDLVAVALKSGNHEITDILEEGDGLRVARELLLRREAEPMAEIRNRQRHGDRVIGAAHEKGAVPTPDGPRR